MADQRKRKITGEAPERPRQVGVTVSPHAWAVLMRLRVPGESVGATISRLVERLDTIETTLAKMGNS